MFDPVQTLLQKATLLEKQAEEQSVLGKTEEERSWYSEHSNQCLKAAQDHRLAAAKLEGGA